MNILLSLQVNDSNRVPWSFLKWKTSLLKKWVIQLSVYAPASRFVIKHISIVW